jgi:hypothetical protein
MVLCKTDSHMKLEMSNESSSNLLSSSFIADQALKLLLSHLRPRSFRSNVTCSSSTTSELPFQKSSKANEVPHCWHVPIPCSIATDVQESTSTLFTARALAKAGYVNYAWESLHALLSGQSEDGWIPKYQYHYDDSDYECSRKETTTTTTKYPESKDNTKDTNVPHISMMEDYWYIPNTTIPGPKLGSFLSALPLHASVVLDVFAWSPQLEEDVQHLLELYIKIYRYHHFMVEHRPQYWHPWESLWDPHSWILPLKPIRGYMKSINWSLPFKIPHLVRNSYGYHPDVYEPSIFLLECMAAMTRNETDDDCPSSFKELVSVEHSAIWIQAHRDIIQMRQVLQDRHRDWELVHIDLNLPYTWLESSQQRWNRLWDENVQMYLPQWNNESMGIADASLLVALWPLSNETDRIFPISSRLFQRNDYQLRNTNTLDDNMKSLAWNCGAHALWSRGGCPKPSVIVPLINYLVAMGLNRNHMLGMGHFMVQTTLKLMLIQEQEFQIHQSSQLLKQHSLVFAEMFDASTGLPLLGNDAKEDVCSLTSTLTAALLYNLATVDPPRTFHPDPPIRSSGVIVLMIMELVVALAIGASCLFLNLKMLRESSRLVQEEAEREDGFFTTAGSLGEYNYEPVGELLPIDEENSDE